MTVSDKQIKKCLKGEIFKPIKNKDGSDSEYEISNKGRIRVIDSKREVKPNILTTWGTSWSKKMKLRPENKQRKHIYLKFKDWIFSGNVARLELMTFCPLDDYTNMEADHIDENPQNDILENLQWITTEENRVKAANARGRNYTVYDDSIIHKICQEICNKTPRKEIKSICNVPGPLIDDISSGRSHKDISSQYIEKGFVYREYSKKKRIKRQELIHKICKLIDKGYSNQEIVSKLKLPKKEICLPNDIRKFRVYKYISQDYDFYKSSDDDKKVVIYDKKET